MLKPVPKVSEEKEVNDPNPVLDFKPISIETALIFGEPDRLYYIEDDSANDEDAKQVIGLNVVNMRFDDEDCSVILFRNWTDNFRHLRKDTRRRVKSMVD